MFTASRRAFTLIELLIVITIIGILAVALVPRITGGPARARDSQRKSDLQQIATALEFYAQDHTGSYPTSSGCTNTLALSDYVTSIPSDPMEKGWNATTCPNDYYYVALNTDADAIIEGYLLVANLETDTDKDDGVYRAGFTVYGTVDAGTHFTANAAKLCSVTTCNDAIYVMGK